MNYARADIKGGMLNLLKTLTCAVDFIKIDCRSSLPIYASPKKLRCEPESSIDRPGAPGRCPRAATACRSQNVCRPARLTAEPCAPLELCQNPVPKPTQPMAGEFSLGHRGADLGTAPQSSKDFHRPLQAWINLTVDSIRLNKPSMGRLA